MMSNGMMGNHLLGTANGYNLFTINGRANPAEPLVAEVGQWTRLRLLNGGFQQHRIHVHGMKAWVTHTDGHLIPQAQPMDELVISPYERLEVLLYGTEPGEYVLHDHDEGHSEAGMVAKIRLKKTLNKPNHKEGKPESELPINARSRYSPKYQNLSAGVIGDDPTLYDRSYRLTIRMGMGSNSQWTLGGNKQGSDDALPIRKGEKIRLTISNMSPESHPMHLHGHEFKIVEIGGQSLSEPWLVKDTVNLQPMESITIAFEANNPPGDWLFHCHQAHHADDGLMTVFRYEK
jgi:FtsP/CotA-like multicopper oxidase with cupredoxin domain